MLLNDGFEMCKGSYWVWGGIIGLGYVEVLVRAGLESINIG